MSLDTRLGGTRRTGILLAVGTAVISGFAVFVNGYGVRAWSEISDSATYTTFKNATAALILVVVGVAAASRHNGKALDREAVRGHWRGLTAIALVGGSVPFLLFFEGLSRATSGDAAFIHKTLVVWVALLAVTLLRERIGPVHVVAIAVLVAGQAALSGVAGIEFGSGEWMILGATLLWSIETVIAKRVLAGVPATTVGIARMAGGSLILVAYVLVVGGLSSLGQLTGAHFVWIAVTGLTLAGYVGTWFAALKRAPAVDVTAVLVGGALITALLESGVRGAAVPSVAGVALVLVGVGLVGSRAWTRTAHSL
ncbi:MAG TPA: DMT family transporter [Acidimicrobiia bacterium]|nr:DMT family transporter [Acidimicrobiia bacterium]